MFTHMHPVARVENENGRSAAAGAIIVWHTAYILHHESTAYRLAGNADLDVTSFDVDCPMSIMHMYGNKDTWLKTTLVVSVIEES